jgi:hypothetical protein
VHATENVTQAFGSTDTGFTITSVDPASGFDSSDLPAVGTVYNVARLGLLTNVYIDTPGADGSIADGTVHDTLGTPFGPIDLSGLVQAFDLGALDPGAAFGVGAGTASDVATSADPLSFLGL